ncbi:hypothetical protein ACLBV5_09385 [Brevundimonas sp. M1A4_2e]
MNLPTLGQIICGVITGVGDEFHSIPPQIVQGQTFRTLNRHDLPSASAA